MLCKSTYDAFEKEILCTTKSNGCMFMCTLPDRHTDGDLMVVRSPTLVEIVPLKCRKSMLSDLRAGSLGACCKPARMHEGAERELRGSPKCWDVSR